MAWDAARYLRFGSERTRPAADLLARVPPLAARRIVDLGCGPGNSTALLAARWPEAALTGLDNAPDMIARARIEGPPGAVWVEADIATATFAESVDLLFANASLHWLPDLSALLPRLVRELTDGGVLAVQLPRNFEAPSHQAIRHVMAEGPWSATLAGVQTLRPVPGPDQLFEWLHPHVSTLDIWETEYLHVLTGEDPVLEWVKGTALTPVLEHLPEDLVTPFLQRLAEALRVAYPRRDDGVTLFPFRRIFCVAIR